MKSKPADGYVKEVVKFAWLPTPINDDVGVWLENYVSVQKYDKYYDHWYEIDRIFYK